VGFAQTTWTQANLAWWVDSQVGRSWAALAQEQGPCRRSHERESLSGGRPPPALALLGVLEPWSPGRTVECPFLGEGFAAIRGWVEGLFPGNRIKELPIGAS